jgi:hypothetical protein
MKEIKKDFKVVFKIENGYNIFARIKKMLGGKIK